jgi:DNA-binding transcriptional regulator GbsR (MarR family)
MRKSTPVAKSGSRARAEQRQIQLWVERVADAFAVHFGLPPITGRILGWLLICDPPEQSAGEIAAAIGASRASLTTSMRLLTVGELVRRRHRPGERTAYFHIDDDAWEKVIRQRIIGMASLREITEDAMALVGPDSARASRVRAAHAFFGWLGEVFATRSSPRGR